jgi:hypothetical protein
MSTTGIEDLEKRPHCWNCNYLGEKQEIDRNHIVSFIKHICIKCNKIKYKEYISEERYEKMHHQMIVDHIRRNYTTSYYDPHFNLETFHPVTFDVNKTIEPIPRREDN